jgi:hypothetical protein
MVTNELNVKFRGLVPWERTGQRHENWPGWYAEYMVAEQPGKELPQ